MGSILLALLAWLVPCMASAPGIVVERVRPDSREAVLLFGGDMMFDRSIRVAATEKGDDFLFSCIAGTLQDADPFACIGKFLSVPTFVFPVT